jgi:hypothetical protein
MSTNKDLFKEAIADAKAVREAALANAKAALEEALTPKLQSMLAAKLQEMDSEEEEKEGLDEVDYISANDKSKQSDFIRSREIAKGHMSESDMEEEDELEEDFDLASILRELSDEEELEEGKDEEELEESKKEELEESDEEELEEAEESEEDGEEAPEAEEANKITDLSVDELKDIIKDIIHAELEQEEYETPSDEEAEMGDMGGEETSADLGTGEEEVNLDELLAELDALDEEKEEEDEAMYEAKKKKADKEDEKDEMKEAIDTINALRNELNETNLLNAKLLYVNKIFKSKNLTESQKLKVIASFDKATTPKQAKELFESIQKTDLSTSKKSIVRESLGFASKAIGGAPKKQIIDTNDQFARWQKLANIK